jgi:streptogramin lyase
MKNRATELDRVVLAFLLLAYGFLVRPGNGYADGLITEFQLPGVGRPSAGGLFYSRAMTAGPDGNIWFTHYVRSKIIRMTTAGGVTEFDLPPDSRPSGLTAASDQNIWFLTTRTPRAAGRISTSGQITLFPLPAGGFPSGLVMAPDGNIWFTEATFTDEAVGPVPTAVGKVSRAGAITRYPLQQGYSGTGIVQTSQGSLWFILSYFSLWGSSSGLERLNLDGTMSSAVDSSVLGGAQSITLGPDGNVWFTGIRSVGKVTPAGTVTKYAVPTANGYPFDITAGPDGNLWFTEYEGNRIGRVTPQGVITEFAVPTPDSQPAAICVGPDGNIWFIEDKANKVGRLIPPSASCTENSLVMCLVGGRYSVTSYWKDQYAGGATANLNKTRLTDAIGAFWLFNEGTLEYLIRINTATDNGRAWISIASFTDVEFWVTVQDTVNGQAQIYHSLPGNRTSIYDPYFFVYP